MKTVYDVTKISGVSRRTLQYYDEIGLLKPDGVKPSGYRLYSETNLERLWRILFYRELNFSLVEIREILDMEPEIEHKLMREHRQLLVEKQNRMKKIVQSIDQILEGDFDESMLENFDTRPFEETKRKNQKLADRRLTENDPFYDFLRPLIDYKLTSRVGVGFMIRNIRSSSNLDWDQIRLAGEPIGLRFLAAMEHGPASKEAMEATGLLIGYIRGQLSACDETVMAQIADQYIKTAAYVDKTRDGLAQFVSDAIRNYCSAPGQ